ncbi:MAG: OmpA family protein [Planctomycetota bacterium]
MKRTVHALACLAVFLSPFVSSGCGLERLKDANRRLKEANDRLIAENNRLEEELAAFQRRLSEKDSMPAQPVPAVAADPSAASALPIDATLGTIDPDVTVKRVPEGIRITIPERVFFALGQASLSARGRSTLDRVASMLRRPEYAGRTIRVDGHTDDIPISKVRNKYPTNWELSTARACVVVRYLVDRGVDPRRVYPAGFAYYRPVSAGKTAEARSQNRRVEITVLDERV